MSASLQTIPGTTLAQGDHFHPIYLSLATPDGANPGCPITHENFSENTEIAILLCGHVFERDALRNHFSRKDPWNWKCPCCNQVTLVFIENSFNSILSLNNPENIKLEMPTSQLSTQTETSDKIKPIAIACIALVTGFILGAVFQSSR